MMWTCCGGAGSGVSMAPACGWISSGQRGSHSHKGAAAAAQKWRWALLTLGVVGGGRRVGRQQRAVDAKLALALQQLQRAASAPRLIAKPPLPAVLRQMLQ